MDKKDVLALRAADSVWFGQHRSALLDELRAMEDGPAAAPPAPLVALVGAAGGDDPHTQRVEEEEGVEEKEEAAEEEEAVLAAVEEDGNRAGDGGSFSCEANALARTSSSTNNSSGPD